MGYRSWVYDTEHNHISLRLREKTGNEILSKFKRLSDESWAREMVLLLLLEEVMSSQVQPSPANQLKQQKSPNSGLYGMRNDL